ncbi:MAG TPA: hypothetical protein VLT33_10840 [Labilithrix sp.]|nr:hypothetical protein [Labilithrix sp.]
MMARLVLPLLVGFAFACSKDKATGEDAAADAAAVQIAVADAAPEAEAPAASVSATPLPTAPVVVKTAAKPAAPDPPICAAARSARARNSPAATNLEAQCRAAGGKP